ncbi:MAG: TetR family transcriptional regulator [Variovorax sp. SCN 67-20]|uniref:TetR/AcrR family transcriptional regulator n=1 Tax=Variovorax sp. SCN 67-20 TaxID=1660153 RepID=UPI0008695B32|nr:TetR/AcrR family transcriptional regulator [Variovorax sp. SCN 67-20]ODV23527.1 MAG: TetR family transcriptional regulator [Variovorax sp. SCN 67-20]
MPKPTKSEIAADIIDAAAALFAKRGFDHTSLQQIADAVNYSKTGLLHHFPSKLAIYSAAIDSLREHALEVREQMKDMPVGIERDRANVEVALQYTYDWPGGSALTTRIAENEPDGDPQLVAIGLIIYEALGIDLAKLDMERIVRVTSAFTGLSVSALQAVRSDLKREWREHIIEAAMGALGHPARSKAK